MQDSVLFTDRWMTVADPSRHVAFDYMHCWFVGGIFNHEVGRALLALREFGVTADKVHQYLAVWRWPASVKGNTGQDAFGPKRAKATLEATMLKATASECLSLWPVLAQFFFGVLSGGTVSAAARPHLECFLLLARVLQLLLSTSRKSVAPDALQSAIQAHLRKYKEVYGPEAMVPKFHYALHFPTFLARMGFLQAAFVLERKHKLPKRFGNQVHTIISKRIFAQPPVSMGLARHCRLCVTSWSLRGSLPVRGTHTTDMLANRGKTREGRKRGERRERERASIIKKTGVQATTCKTPYVKKTMCKNAHVKTPYVKKTDVNKKPHGPLQRLAGGRKSASAMAGAGRERAERLDGAPEPGQSAIYSCVRLLLSPKIFGVYSAHRSAESVI